MTTPANRIQDTWNYTVSVPSGLRTSLSLLCIFILNFSLSARSFLWAHKYPLVFPIKQDIVQTTIINKKDKYFFWPHGHLSALSRIQNNFWKHLLIKVILNAGSILKLPGELSKYSKFQEYFQDFPQLSPPQRLWFNWFEVRFARD